MSRRVEATEYTVKEGSPVTGIQLLSLNKKKDVLVAAIIRKDRVIIPRGSDMILAGDRVVVVSRAKMMDDIADMLA